MTEVWKEVPGWPDYAVSDMGQVKRIRKPRSGRGRVGMILKARIPGGAKYPRLNLTCDGVVTDWAVHRLVMHAFVGPCPDGKEVNHIDGNKLNQALANLEYVTRSENLRHAFVTGLKTAAGEKNSRAKLTEQAVASIKAEYTGAYGQCAALALKYGVSHATVQDIVHGRHWAGVTAVAA
jgi:hypothetical protein